MRILIDADVVYWAVDSPSKLSAQAIAAVQSPANELLLSVGTIWEMAIKVGLGKLTLSLPFLQWMTQAIADLDLTVLPVTVEYADMQSRLPRHHGDPFDRLLVAQAQTEQMPLISTDS